MDKKNGDAESDLSESWFYFAKGETKGPFKIEELLQRYTADRLSPLDLVRSSHSSEWRRFQDAFKVSNAKPLPPIWSVPSFDAFFLAMLPLMSYGYHHLFFAYKAHTKKSSLSEYTLSGVFLITG